MQAGFRAATGHQGMGRAAPQELPESRPIFLKLRAGIMWFLSSPFLHPLSLVGRKPPALSCTGRPWSCDCPCAFLFTLLWVVTTPLSGGPAWLGTLPSTLILAVEGIPCVCVKWEPGPTASGGSPSGGGRGAQSSGQIGPPEFPAASGPLSGLSAAGVSSPRKGLALSSPPSEASTPMDPGDRAQVGSFWGSGGWLR